MTSRYDRLFGRPSFREDGEGVLVTFAMLGDPNPAASATTLRRLIEAGADALELGLPFSDPIADGPVIQAAAVRALAAGTRPDDWWALIAEVRRAAPDLPIGLLVYANLVLRPGLDRFYDRAAAAGVDSVLVADLPLEEAEPFVDAARRAAVAPIFIAPPNVPPDRLARIAARTQGYTYVTTRPGVTGEDRHEYGDLADRLATLRRLGAPPSLLGFGVSTPSQVRSALSAGAAGVIVGSAMVRRAAETGAAALLDVFVRELKEATRPTQARPRPAGGALR